MLDERLVGRWKGVVSEELVTMEFSRQGTLTYTIHCDGKDQKMLLRYKTVDGMIITDQPSDPRQERTNYRINAAGLLVLQYEGETSIFKRV